MGTLIWEREVGVRSRAKEREEEIEAAKQAKAYAKSRRELIRRQQQE